MFCPLYNRQRQIFFHDLQCPPTVNNILFGDENLSFAQNKTCVPKCPKLY